MNDKTDGGDMGGMLDKIKFDEHGLVPAIVQDADTKEVLMLAYMNRDSLQKTMETRKTYFYSRSRKKLWLKGESSGHIQEVQGVYLDCDNDTILITARQKGGACHTGYYSCFYTRWDGGGKTAVIGKKVFDPGKTYK